MKPYKLEVQGSNLVLGGEIFKLRSGAIHYYRVHPNAWYDRLLKLKACGLNTVETCIPWNFHEEYEGEFNFSGAADIVRFIEFAEELGLYVILRPGPFMCAEWEMGGYPAWLTQVDGIVLRHLNKPYLEKASAFFDELFPRLIPHLSTHGGSIIAMQLENEFGGFKQPAPEYMKYLRDEFIRRGIDVLLFTSDGTWDNCLADGSVDGVLMTANFGSHYRECFDKLEALRPGEPKVCMEFWDGWFDAWGEEHNTRDTASAIQELEGIIRDGGHFSLYMFYGGTNFGFMNGANTQRDFDAIITSYDYGAPLTEDGEVTELYTQIRELIIKYDGVNPPPVPPRKTKMAYGHIDFTKSAPLSALLPYISKEFISEKPLTMEECGEYYGYILYRANVNGMNGSLVIREPRDRVMIYGDGKYLGLIERGGRTDKIIVNGVSEITLLIENMGRVNYGPHILDKKGLVSDLLIGGKVVTNFVINALPMRNLNKLELPEAASQTGPAVYMAKLEINGEPTDTFILPSGFTKGHIEINGFNIGRYFRRGPQQTLYVPVEILNKGKNTVVIFDFYPSDNPYAEFVSEPILDEIKEI